MVTVNNRVTIEVPAWVGDLLDRGGQAALLLVAGAAVGFAVVGLGWSGVAARLYVALQLPYLASGALAGAALVGTCLGLLAVHVERRAAAVDRLQLDQAIRATSTLTETLPGYIARRRVNLVHNGPIVHRADCRMATGRNLPRLTNHAPPGDRRPCRICQPPVGD